MASGLECESHWKQLGLGNIKPVTEHFLIMWEDLGSIFLTTLVHMHKHTEKWLEVQAWGWLYAKGMLRGDLLFLGSS